MRYYIYIIVISTITVLTSCGKNPVPGIPNDPSGLNSITTGEELEKAIDNITSNTNLWTPESYETLRTKINSLYAARIIQSADAPLENLYVQSVSCLKNRVDEEFKKSSYTNYHRLKADLAFLKEDNDFLYNIGVISEKPDSRLEEVQDIFNNYEAVFSMSKYSFAQKAEIMRPYSGDYTPTENRIKSNKYYGKYFSKNSEIAKGVKEFPTRLKASEEKYYNDLEELIENEIVEQRMSVQECWHIVAEFQNITKGQNPNKALDKLTTFVKEYIKTINNS